jgi:hypothetical protein
LPLDHGLVQSSQLGAVSTPNTSFPAELHSGIFAPVGRWKKQLTSEEIRQLESLIGDELQKLGYLLSSLLCQLSPACTCELCRLSVLALFLQGMGATQNANSAAPST